MPCYWSFRWVHRMPHSNSRCCWKRTTYSSEMMRALTCCYEPYKSFTKHSFSTAIGSAAHLTFIALHDMHHIYMYAHLPSIWSSRRIFFLRFFFLLYSAQCTVFIRGRLKSHSIDSKNDHSDFARESLPECCEKKYCLWRNCYTAPNKPKQWVSHSSGALHTQLKRKWRMFKKVFLAHKSWAIFK